jgi:ParB family chromosome partitioning protein
MDTYIDKGEDPLVTTIKKQGLGRGLQALLQGALNQSDNAMANATVPVSRSAVKISDPVEFSSDSSISLKNYAEVPIKQVIPGSSQPRQHMDPGELQELSDSIRAQGILQPLVVRLNDKKQYEIIAGERRYRAAKLAGLEQVPVIIKDVSDETAVAMALIENIQRSDLNPMEEAFGLDRLSREFQLTHQQVAQAVGKSRATVSNLLRLLTLNADVQDLLRQQRIDMGHAKVLLAVKGSLQSSLAAQVVEEGLSVRETEMLLLGDDDDANEDELENTVVRADKMLDPNIKFLQEDLSQRLGAKTLIQYSPETGKGKLVVHYHSLDELDGVLSHIQ